MTDIEDSASDVAKFYNHFKTNEEDSEVTYSERKLVVLGLLLSQGSVIQKAINLYEEYDPNAENCINSDTFQEMVSDLISVSMVGIPFSASRSQGEDLELLKTYGEIIEDKAVPAITQIT